MDTQAFSNSLTSQDPPAGLSGALEALWHEAKGDWQRAHKLAQRQKDGDGYWVHAYLHRVEGDDGNADNWYRRAARKAGTGSLKEEWQLIVGELLTRAQ